MVSTSLFRRHLTARALNETILWVIAGSPTLDSRGYFLAFHSEKIASAIQGREALRVASVKLTFIIYLLIVNLSNLENSYLSFLGRKPVGSSMSHC